MESTVQHSQSMSLLKSYPAHNKESVK